MKAQRRVDQPGYQKTANAMTSAKPGETQVKAIAGTSTKPNAAPSKQIKNADCIND